MKRSSLEVLKTIGAVVLLAGFCACHVGVEESEVLAMARSPHGIEVAFELAPETNRSQIQGELLEVRTNGFLIEVGVPHELVFVPLETIVKAALSTSKPASRPNKQHGRPHQRAPSSLKKLPRDSKKRQKLLDELRPLSRFPQGLSPALLNRLQTELNIPQVVTLSLLPEVG